MWGRYSSTDTDELTIILDTLHKHNVMPALSCGMHPGIVNAIKQKFGNEFMANTGGAIHGHPGGSLNGAILLCEVRLNKISIVNNIRWLLKNGD
jgi:ribulose 1,5-bisphosphate carboxylase large subunit-like protein